MLRTAIIVFLFILLPSPARAEARLIGNEAYASEIGRLANPHNDVGVLEQALKGLTRARCSRIAARGQQQPCARRCA